MKQQHAFTAITLSVATLMGSGGVQAQSKEDFEAMRAEILRLSAEVQLLKSSNASSETVRINAIEEKQRAAVVQGEIPGSFRLPGSQTSVLFYGMARGDMIHDFKSTAPNDNFNNLPLQPLDGSGAPSGKTKLTAEFSRFGVKTSTPTENGLLNTRLEGDFYGYCSSALNSNACNRDRFRIRHAFGEYNGLLVGQTSSTFSDPDTLPETLDLIGPIGAPAWRRAMVRYSANTPLAKLSVALEEPRGSSNGVAAKSPDLVLRADKSFGDTVSANMRLISHETRSSAGYDKRGSGIGFGASFNATARDLLVAQASFVQGNGDLMWGSNGDTDDKQRILLDRVVGVNLGWTHTFSAQWRTNLAYGGLRSKAGSDFVATYGASGQFGANKNLQQVYLNAIYTPIKNVDLGAEYSWGRRTTFADQKGTQSRLAFMGKYSF